MSELNKEFDRLATRIKLVEQSISKIQKEIFLDKKLKELEMLISKSMPPQ